MKCNVYLKYFVYFSIYLHSTNLYPFKFTINVKTFSIELHVNITYNLARKIGSTLYTNTIYKTHIRRGTFIFLRSPGSQRLNR